MIVDSSRAAAQIVGSLPQLRAIPRGNLVDSGVTAPVQAKPGYYRAQAERCRMLAKRVLDWDIKQTLLDVAEEYEKLAMEAERKR